MIDMSSSFWRKHGLLVAPSAGLEGYTHASHPCVLHLKNDEFLLIFSMRNMRKQSHVFSLRCLVENGQISLLETARMSLSPGRMGTFDCEGLLSCCAVRINSQSAFFYYSGWNNFADKLWLCDTGLARIDIDTLEFHRMFDGPVMCRSRFNPYFAAGTSVLKDGALYRSWYNSGVEWFRDTDGAWSARYGIHYAESQDGVDWKYRPGLVIPFQDSYEHSFGRPTVIKDDGVFHMWFSCRGASGDRQYRLGYAYSVDGINWARNDGLAGMSTSCNDSDFDSNAQAYPYPFEHKGVHYLLYNGNNYGATGVGYAVLEKSK